MKDSFRMKRLDQKGFSHFIIPLIVIVLVMLIGVKLLLGSHAQTPPNTSTQHVLWGSWVKPGIKLNNPTNGPISFNGNSTAAFSQQETRIGRKFDIIHRYENFPSFTASQLTSMANADIKNGNTPFYNLSNGSSKGIWAATANGKYDSYIKSLAHATDNINGTIYLNWMHEPTTYPEGTPADFKAGFAHFHDVMEANKTKHNVKYVMILTAENISKNPNAYYPGNKKVDIIGSDGYNWACTLHNKVDNRNKNGCGAHGWRSFQQVFETTNTWANSQHSPWWVTEVGVAEDPNTAGRKAQWFTGMENFLESHQIAVNGEESWSGMQGFIYYQGGVNAPVFNVGSSASALAAYKTVGNDAFFGGGSKHGQSSSITNIAPSSGTLAGGTNVRLTINNYPSGTPTVTFGGKAANNVVRSGNTITATTPAGSVGSVDVVVTVDSTTATDASGYTYTAPPMPDLIVTSVTANPSNAPAGSLITFSATISNQGNAAIPAGSAFGLGFYVDGVEVSYAQGFAGGLTAGGSATLTANASPSGSSNKWRSTAGAHTVVAKVNDLGKIAESNTTNNSLSIPLNVVNATVKR